MPGVTYGKEWISENPRARDYNSFSSRSMSPKRKHDLKSSSASQYSNEYGSERSEGLQLYPTYLLEHLATFSVGLQYGIQSPKDGLRRLLQMEKSSGIWTQKMQMRLEKKWIVIIDHENGDIVERFPMSLIGDPTSYTSNDPRELYNNVIVFIVKDELKNKNHNPPEMHIFQCARVSAQEVVNEMKMFINGKWKPSFRNNRNLPPAPMNPPPEPPHNGVNVKEQVNHFNAVAAAAASTSSPPRSEMVVPKSPGYYSRQEDHSDRPANYNRDFNDETSSISSEKYERDVAILNHCFDDIERFIARLQHAAAAFKELERRQKSRRSKKKDLGDGMLSMRAKPPMEREFVDIMQKFKLSFNLLAKLKSHIHDPNAPELVHFLFTPLALIVDAAKDSNYSTVLSARVVAPLLTRDAIELLMNCCTSKENDLWHSLGDAWIIPREQWKGLEGNYHPVFADGWAPENPISVTKENTDISPNYRFLRDNSHESEARPDFTNSRQDMMDSHYDSEIQYNEHVDRPITPLHASDIDTIFYNNQQSTPKVPYDRSEAITPLMSEPELNEQGDRDMRSDFSADSIDHSDPQRYFEVQQRQWLDDMKSRGAKIVQVMYPRTANNDKELTVIRDEYLEIIDDSRKWWKARNARGQVAHVPHTIVSPPNEDGAFNNPIYGTGPSNDMKDQYYNPNDSLATSNSLENETDGSSPFHKSSAMATPAPADWVKRERQGKKGEFRYF